MVDLCHIADDVGNAVLVNYADAGAKMFFQAAGPCATRTDGRIAVELRVLCDVTAHQSALSDVSTTPNFSNGLFSMRSTQLDELICQRF